MSARSLSLGYKSVERKGADILYLNVCMPFGRPLIAQSKIGFEAKYTETRSEQVLDNPSDWYMSVVRFNVPTSLIPIFFVGVQGGGGTPFLEFKATASVGSAVLTGVSSTVGLTVGQIVALNGVFAPGTTIAIIGPGDTLTLSNPALANAPTTTFRAATAALIPDQPNPNLLNYSVSLQAPGGPVRQAFLVWVPEVGPGVVTFPTTASLPLDPISGGNSVPNPLTQPAAYQALYTTPNLLYYSEYSYQHFINLINTAFAAAFALASLDAGWPAAATFPPFMTYDPVTSLVSLTAQTAYDSAAAAPALIGTFMNAELYEFFQGTFNVISNGIQGLFPGPVTASYGADYTFIIGNTGKNAVANIPNPGAVAQAGFEMKQEFAALILWSDFQGISFRTNNIPILPEYPAAASSSISDAGGVPIVTDYYPSSSGSGTDLRTFITYIPQSEYRLTDLIGTSPISKIDFQVFWNDSLGNAFPVFVTHNLCVGAKIMFRKKSIGGALTWDGPKVLEGGAASGRRACARCASGGCRDCSK
jgi:hypothetical protein